MVGAKAHPRFDLSSIFLLLILLGSFCLLPGNAGAHNLDPNSIDRCAEITLTPNQLILIYEVVLGLIPTESETSELDTDKDGKFSSGERDAYVKIKAERFLKKQSFHAGDTLLQPQFVQGDVYSTIGHNNIGVLKIDLAFACSLPAGIPRGTTIPFVYQDENFVSIPGWKQIQFNGRQGVTFSGHIPYSELKKFDYNTMDMKGYMPQTDALRIEISVPPPRTEAEAASIQMPEKIDLSAIPKYNDVPLLLGIWSLLAGLTIVFGVIYFGMKYRLNSKREPK